MVRIVECIESLLSQSCQGTQFWLRLITFDRRPSVYRQIMIINLLLLFLQSCGLDVEDPTLPSTPVWVQKSIPEEWPERGIDAHELGGIYLEWHSSNEVDIVNYSIYRAVWDNTHDSLGKYKRIFILENDGALDPHVVDYNAALRKHYSYKIRSKDAAQNMSDFSKPVSYMLLPPITGEMMEPNGVTDTLSHNRELSWNNNYISEVENYCLTILSNYNELSVRVILQPKNYLSGLETWSIPRDVPLGDGELYKWRIDIVSRYSNNIETWGSESSWATFTNIN
jgi:hypothetical protein